jgi:hypothetical protein
MATPRVLMRVSVKVTMAPPFFEAGCNEPNDCYTDGYNSGFDVGFNEGWDLREDHGLED